jgi:hypothetical protein
MKAAGLVACRAGMLARVENQSYARRNARERQDVLQGRRLGVLIFMMKGRHGRISLNRSIARCSKRSIGGASSGGRLRILTLIQVFGGPDTAHRVSLRQFPQDQAYRWP